MPAEKRGHFGKGKGGRPSKYKPEYAATAQKLCAISGYTDEMLAEFFEVCKRTIDMWKLTYPEFKEALRVGKAETDDMVERSAVAHMNGYYVTVDEMDRFGSVKQMKKWIPGNAHAAMKWLQARRPETYREQKEVKHALSMDDAFLQFLDKMDEDAKRRKALNARRQVIELQAIDVRDGAQAPQFLQPTHARPEADAAEREVGASDGVSLAPMLIDQENPVVRKSEPDQR